MNRQSSAIAQRDDQIVGWVVLSTIAVASLLLAVLFAGFPGGAAMCFGFAWLVHSIRRLSRQVHS